MTVARTLRVLVAGAMPALCALAAAPAQAQWQVGAGPGLRYAAHGEYDAGGRRLVHETGWLPGIALQAAWTAGPLTWRAAVDAYRGDIGYHGRTQAGMPAGSTTSTTLATLAAGVAWTFAGDTALRASVEADRWRRDIAGTASAIGLQERYGSTRLYAGAARTFHPAAGTVAGEASVFTSTPERMRVAFSGRFDPAAFDGARVHGLRLGLALRPAQAPWLEVRARFDRAQASRSADVALTQNGQYLGSIAQPEHVRQAVTFTVSAIY